MEDEPGNAPPPMQEANGDVDGFEALGGDAVTVSSEDIESVETVTVEQDQDVMSAVLNLDGRGSANGGGGGVSPVPVPREEPETIRRWRLEQEQRLVEKDAAEAKTMEELRGRAEKELKDWYGKYQDQLDKTKGENRAGEKAFVAQMDEIAPGTEWDRVAKLCEFNAKKQNSAKDMTRMRSILLQLKQNPKPVLQAS